MIRKKKVVITGHFGVGKTSLFSRFINNDFSEKYLTTIKTRIGTKVFTVDKQEVSLIFWDLAGEVSQEKVLRANFNGAAAVLYIFDLSRPATFRRMDDDVKYIQTVLPKALIWKVGNKKDLIPDENLKGIEKTTQPHCFTSARTGENVFELLEGLAKALFSK